MDSMSGALEPSRSSAENDFTNIDGLQNDSPFKKKLITHRFSLNPLASDYKGYNRGSPKVTNRSIGPKLKDRQEPFYLTNLRPAEKDKIDLESPSQ